MNQTNVFWVFHSQNVREKSPRPIDISRILSKVFSENPTAFPLKRIQGQSKDICPDQQETSGTVPFFGTGSFKNKN